MNKWHRNYLIRRYLYGPALTAVSYLLFFLGRFIPNKIYSLNKPIFLIGVSRSGTTIFTELFARHSDICNWSEAPQVLELNFYKKGLHHIKEHQASRFDKFRIKFFFGFKTFINGKSVFVNKHPENSLRIKFLLSIFPNAKFVHVIRDGRAVVSSNYARSRADKFRHNWPFGQFPKPPNWESYLEFPDHIQYAYQWVDIIAYIKNTRKTHLTKESYIEIKYEDLCKDTHDVLRELDQFCSLPLSGRDYRLVSKNLSNQNSKLKWNFSLAEGAKIDEIIRETRKTLGYN